MNMEAPGIAPEPLSSSRRGRFARKTASRGKERGGEAFAADLFGQSGPLNARDGTPRDPANGGPGTDRCATDSGDRRVICP